MPRKQWSKERRAQLDLQRYYWPGDPKLAAHSVLLEQRWQQISFRMSLKSIQHTGFISENSIMLGEQIGVTMPQTEAPLAGTYDAAWLDKTVHNTHASLRIASERLGIQAANELLIERGYVPILDNTESARNGQFDGYAVSLDEKRILVLEVKGGYNFGPNPRYAEEIQSLVGNHLCSWLPSLGDRNIHSGDSSFRAEQGSVKYFEALVRSDGKFQELLEKSRNMRDQLAKGEIKIEYFLVHADYVGGVRIWSCDITSHNREIWDREQEKEARQSRTFEAETTDARLNPEATAIPTNNRIQSQDRSRAQPENGIEK